MLRNLQTSDSEAQSRLSRWFCLIECKLIDDRHITFYLSPEPPGKSTSKIVVALEICIHARSAPNNGLIVVPAINNGVAFLSEPLDFLAVCVLHKERESERTQVFLRTLPSGEPLFGLNFLDFRQFLAGRKADRHCSKQTKQNSHRAICNLQAADSRDSEKFLDRSRFSWMIQAGSRFRRQCLLDALCSVVQPPSSSALLEESSWRIARFLNSSRTIL